MMCCCIVVQLFKLISVERYQDAEKKTSTGGVPKVTSIVGEGYLYVYILMPREGLERVCFFYGW